MGKLSLSEIIKKKSSEPKVVKIPRNSVITPPVFDEPSKDIEEITEKLKNFHISPKNPVSDNKSKDVEEITEKLKNFHISPKTETKIPKNSVDNDNDYIRKDDNGNYIVDFPKYMNKNKDNIVNYEIKKIPVIPKVSCGCSSNVQVPKISSPMVFKFGVSVPKVSAPKVQPIFKFGVSVPKVSVPKVSAPKVQPIFKFGVSVPKVSVPKVSSPIFKFGRTSIPKVSVPPTIKFVRAKDDSNEQYKFSKIPSKMKKFTVKSN
jgi:hypothetical protein